MSRETRRFVQTAAAAMALVDADGSLVAWSPPFARLCRKAPRTGDPVAPALAVVETGGSAGLESMEA